MRRDVVRLRDGSVEFDVVERTGVIVWFQVRRDMDIGNRTGEFYLDCFEDFVATLYTPCARDKNMERHEFA
jgi:hypothetical protein